MSRKRRRRSNQNNSSSPQSNGQHNPQVNLKVRLLEGHKAIVQTPPPIPQVLFTESPKVVRKRSPWWKRIFMLPSSRLYG